MRKIYGKQTFQDFSRAVSLLWASTYIVSNFISGDLGQEGERGSVDMGLECKEEEGFHYFMYSIKWSRLKGSFPLEHVF